MAHIQFVTPSCDNPAQALHIVLGAMSLEQRAVAPQLDAAALVAEKGRLAVMQVRPRRRTRRDWHVHLHLPPVPL